MPRGARSTRRRGPGGPRTLPEVARPALARDERHGRVGAGRRRLGGSRIPPRPERRVGAQRLEGRQQRVEHRLVPRHGLAEHLDRADRRGQGRLAQPLRVRVLGDGLARTQQRPAVQRAARAAHDAHQPPPGGREERPGLVGRVGALEAAATAARPRSRLMP